MGPLAWTLPFGLIGVPAVLMGGTLPALLRSLRLDSADVPPATGVLYAANTAGAVVGTLATPFLLVPAFGIEATGVVACLLGLGSAGAAYVLDRSLQPPPAMTPRPDEERPAARMSKDGRLALGLYAAAGGIALGYEVVWSELLVQFMSTRSYAFAVMLGTYLTGLALGGLLYARLGRRDHDPWRALGALLAAAAVSALAIVSAIGPWMLDAQAFAGMWAPWPKTQRQQIEYLHSYWRVLMQIRWQMQIRSPVYHRTPSRRAFI